MRKIRTLVVDDSSFNRKVIVEALNGHKNIEVIETAFDGEDAIRKILRLSPDVMTLDLEMPGMDGFAVLRWVMANHPLPIIVVSARESDRSVFKALDLGAVDFIVKPSKVASPKLKNINNELRSKVLSIPLLHFDRVRQRTHEEPAAPPEELPETTTERRARVVVLAASTGGPPALQTILMGLSPRILSPVVMCQHMPAIFTRLFAERLSTLGSRPVSEARDRELLQPGHAYVAPGGKQLRIEEKSNKLKMRVFERCPGERFAPSADILLKSVAEACGGECLAAVLTGMGDDGARGALAVHEAGGIVLAESEESAVIFGMPREVIKAGAADRVEDIRGITMLINMHALVKN